jgi:hypothetical protein
MTINDKLIKAFITSSGIVLIGEEELVEEVKMDNDGQFNVKIGSFNKIKLLRPFRFQAQQGDDGLRLGVMAPIIKEEWCILDLTGSIECQVNDIVKETYIKYAKQVFSSIILPEEKQLII